MWKLNFPGSAFLFALSKGKSWDGRWATAKGWDAAGKRDEGKSDKKIEKKYKSQCSWQVTQMKIDLLLGQVLNCRSPSKSTLTVSHILIRIPRNPVDLRWKRKRPTRTHLDHERCSKALNTKGRWSWEKKGPSPGRKTRQCNCTNLARVICRQKEKEVQKMKKRDKNTTKYKNAHP